MEQAFIIMQIGNPELDRVCKQAIVPALEACGFEPKRIPMKWIRRKAKIPDYDINI